MGCVASRLEEEEEVVSICRDRKRLLKVALQRRHALAEAHCRYFQALYAVAAAIKLFVARHSSPSSPFLITFPPHAITTPPTPTPPPPQVQDQLNVINNPMFLQQTPSHSTKHEACIGCQEDPPHSCRSSVTSSLSSSDSSDQEEEANEQKEVGGGRRSSGGFGGEGYFYSQVQPPPSQSPGRVLVWDFFNPFEGVRPPGFVSGYRRSYDDEFRVVREQEGIPDLEEDDAEQEVEKEVGDREDGQEKREMEGLFDQEEEEEESRGCDMAKLVVDEHGGNGSSEGENSRTGGLAVMESADEGRELLEALKDIMDHFIRAWDAGKDLSRMFEATTPYLQPGFPDIKENSTKLIQALPWHRSASLKPSYCKSLVASCSKNPTSWTGFKNDLFDDYGVMGSGSHSLTLGRLYAWEKKLYEEVKAGDTTRKAYERKCLRLRDQDVRGDDEGKTRADVKDLYARILVAIRRAEKISKIIGELRDEELQPQIIELLEGLTRSWKIILESHETQNKIVSEVKSFACPTYGKFCNDSHRLATLQLEAELENWRVCFREYFVSQKAYVEALHGWLTKFLVPGIELHSRSSAAPTFGANGPPLLLICRAWLSSMENLPDKAVSYALKSFSKDVRALWCQQGEEQQQKRKVDNLAKELDRRMLAIQKLQSRLVEMKLIGYKPDLDGEQRFEHLAEKRDHLDLLRKRLDAEKDKHLSCMQETKRITLNGFQTGFVAIFESLAEFSKASVKMYNDLVGYCENVGEVVNQTSVESSQVEVTGSRQTEISYI